MVMWGPMWVAGPSSLKSWDFGLLVQGPGWALDPAVAEQSAHSCCAWGDREAGQCPWLRAHLALQRYVVNAAASMQHPSKQAGVQHWGLPLFGYNAFAGAEKQVRPMVMRVLALKVDDLSMATVHTNVGPDQCPVGDISLNRKRSPSSGSLSSNSTASKCWPRKASEKKNLMVLTAPVTAWEEK